MSTTETQRRQNRERQQKLRDRRKQEFLQEQAAAEEQALRRGRDLHFFGEEAPGHAAKTSEAEIAVHREFARALSIPDLADGETLRDFARRVFNAWHTGPYTFMAYAPAFSRQLQQFDEDFGFEVEPTAFNSWAPPADCTGDEPIDVSKLLELPPLA